MRRSLLFSMLAMPAVVSASPDTPAAPAQVNVATFQVEGMA